MPLIKATQTDRHGSFNFGVLQPGHYTLVVDDEGWRHSDWFDFQVTNLPQEMATVTVDISQNFPDCKGGCELIVKTK